MKAKNSSSALMPKLFLLFAFMFASHNFAAQAQPPNVCDYCILQFPATLSATSGGTTEVIYGRIFEAGVTEDPGNSPAITAQVGYGPVGTDPQDAPGWTYFNAAYNVQVGNDDEYMATMVAPTEGIYRYVFRFSLDGGATWSYADLDGAGTNAGFTFDPNNIGTMNVFPSSAPTVVTNAASQINASTATLTASANPNAGATTGWFRYSTISPGTCNDVFGTRAPTTGGTPLGSGTTAVPFSENIAGLSPQTTYYFCAIASNSISTSFGSVLSFTTPASIPTINVSPGSLAFGNVTIGATSPSQNVTLSNTGTDDLHIGAVTKAGASADYSIINSPANTTVAPGGSVQFMVEFTPSTAGSRLASISIASDDPVNPSTTVNLSGSGVECPVVLSMSKAHFEYNGGSGTINVINSPPCQWFAVSNVPWITISGNASGTGNGTVAYTVAPQNGFDPLRTGTITVGNKTFTVTQFSLNLPIVQIFDGVNVQRNSTINVPVRLAGLDGQYGVVSFETTITYDPAVLTYTGFDTSTSVAEFTMAGNSPEAGTIRIAGFGTQPIPSGGDLLSLHFSVIGPIGSTSPLTFASFFFNEGSPVVQRNHGSVTVIGGSISGSVTYGTAVAVTPVAGATLTAAGSTPVTTLSGADGSYSLPGLGLGSYVVTPSKAGDVSGITAADASAVLQYLVGLASLNANQQAAADVTGNSTISAFDAAQIARYAVVLPDTFLTGTWKFIPSSRSYESVASDITGENYTAILMGEVTGNWSPSTSLLESAFASFDKEEPASANARPSPGSIKLSLPSLTVPQGIALIPLTLANYNGQIVTSYQFELRYNPSVLVPDIAPIDLTTSTSAGYGFEFNASEPGLLRVAAYGVNPIAGNGTLANLRFNVVGPARSRSDLVLEKTMLNEGNPTITAQNGKITVKR